MKKIVIIGVVLFIAFLSLIGLKRVYDVVQEEITMRETERWEKEKSEKEEAEEQRKEDEEETKEKLGEKLIQDYYQRISDGDLQGAYDLKAPGQESFEEFRKIYTGGIQYVVSSLSMYSNGNFHFNVYGYNPTSGGILTGVYWVEMSIVDGKLKTEYVSREQEPHSASVNNIRADVAYRDDGLALIVTENGKQKEVAREYFKDSVGDVFNLRLSEDGKFLVYGYVGSEWHGGAVVDVKAAKEVHNVEGESSDFGFGRGGEFYYECTSAGLMPFSYISLYNTKDFSLKKSLDEYLHPSLKEPTCSYDNTLDLFKFEISDYRSNTDDYEIYTYQYDPNFETVTQTSGPIIKKADERESKDD